MRFNACNTTYHGCPGHHAEHEPPGPPGARRPSAVTAWSHGAAWRPGCGCAVPAVGLHAGSRIMIMRTAATASWAFSVPTSRAWSQNKTECYAAVEAATALHPTDLERRVGDPAAWRPCSTSLSVTIPALGSRAPTRRSASPRPIARSQTDAESGDLRVREPLPQRSNMPHSARQVVRDVAGSRPGCCSTLDRHHGQ